MRFALERFGHVHDLIRQEQWTPSRLAAEVHHRASVLQRLCRPADNRFVIAHADSPSFFADLFAVWEAGASAVCVNPALTAAELGNVVDFVDARALLVDEGQAAPSQVPVLCTAREPTSSAPRRAAGGNLDGPALILFTSGTTGQPKGVVHSHRSILARVALNAAQIGARTFRRSLCVLPTHFGHGLIGNCLTPLLAGGDLFLMPGAGVARLVRLGELIEQHQIGFMSSVPSFWRLALKVARPPRPGVLQRVHIGSAPLSAELWRGVMGWAGTDAVANMYGMTETANWAGGALASEFAPEDGLLGRPWGGQFAILDSDGRPQTHGQGEILVQSPSLMSGYLHRPDLTSEVLVDGWYRSGDTGSLDAEGVLRLTGRERYVINRGGIKIHPEELDLLLERHDHVEEACAFAIADPVAGEAVGVAVRLQVGAGTSPRQLTDWLRGRIRPEAVPNRIFVVAEIPKTERGKLQREQVARHCLATLDLGQAGDPP